MKQYAIGEITVTDPAWVQEYIANVTGLIQKYGGVYLARTDGARRMEGERELPSVYVIIEWPDAQAAQRFYQSEEYAPYLEKRLAGSTGQFVLVPGEDFAAAGG